LTPELEVGARRVAAFLRRHGVQFEGEFATVAGCVIVDIGMRMLRPRELYLAQGFPRFYEIARGLDELDDGRLVEIELTGTAQVKMCGNSVCPPMAEALVVANIPRAQAEAKAA
jgi:DNA (cytosine-5)-methyltransferase 1